MKPSIDISVIDKTNAWPFVEAKKILKERKHYIAKKKKLFYRQVMGQVDYLIQAPLEKLQEPQ